jgi:hypothetical protein
MKQGQWNNGGGSGFYPGGSGRNGGMGGTGGVPRYPPGYGGGVEVEAFYKKDVRILEIFRMKHWLTSPLYGTLHPSSSETRRLSSPSPSISGRVFGGGRGTLMGW